MQITVATANDNCHRCGERIDQGDEILETPYAWYCMDACAETRMLREDTPFSLVTLHDIFSGTVGHDAVLFCAFDQE